MQSAAQRSRDIWFVSGGARFCSPHRQENSETRGGEARPGRVDIACEFGWCYNDRIALNPTSEHKEATCISDWFSSGILGVTRKCATPPTVPLSQHSPWR